MIKSIFAKILMLVCLGIVTFFAINKICLAATPNQIDGAQYPVKVSGLWDVEFVPYMYGYKAKPFTCKINTTYQGSGGVQARMTILQSDGSYVVGIAKYGQDTYINSDKFFISKSYFKQPTMEVLNEGCSKYLDGDKCDNENNRPIIYVTCTYTN